MDYGRGVKHNSQVSSIHSLFTKIGSTSGKAGLGKKDHEFSFGYVEFEVLIG